LREQPVWGLDAYTRHNVRLALESDAPFQALAASLGAGGGRGGALSGAPHGVAIAAFRADPKQPLQLSVALGDTFVVLDRSSADEWRVKNEHTGQEGWVPPPCLDTQGLWVGRRGH
jgi:hypothetical protein